MTGEKDCATSKRIRDNHLYKPSQMKISISGSAIGASAVTEVGFNKAVSASPKNFTDNSHGCSFAQQTTALPGLLDEERNEYPHSPCD